MPSGSKKRKAAKKKKAMEESSLKPAHGHLFPESNADKESDDGVKSHDERESDVGEPGSPASQDPQPSPDPSDDQFPGEEVENDSRTSSVRPFASENKLSDAPLDKLNDMAAQAIHEFEPKQNSEGPDNVKELHGGQSSRDNSDTTINNSDNMNKNEKAHDSMLDALSQDNSVEPDVHIPETASHLTETSPPVEACNLVKETDPGVDSPKECSLPELNASQTETLSTQSSVDSSVARYGLKENELSPSSDEVTRAVSRFEENELSPSSEEAIRVVSWLKENESSPSAEAVRAVSVFNENGLSPSAEEASKAVSAPFGSASEGNEEKVVLNDNIMACSNGMGSASQVDKDKSLPTSDVSSVKLGNVMNPPGHADVSEVKAECSESQPSTVSAPSVAKMSSWKSCCGLFDALVSNDK